MTEGINEKSLVRLPDPMVLAANMPRPGELELMERNFEPLRDLESDLRAACRVSDSATIEKAIERGQRTLANTPFKTLSKSVDQASKPATRKDIANFVAALVGCFSGGTRDPIFARILSEDVGALQPTFGALESACRTVRRTSKFMPAIAEVLEAIELAEGRLRQASHQVGQIPQLLAEAKANLRMRIEQREQLRKEQEELRKKQEEQEETWQRYGEENGELHPDAPVL